MDAEGARVLVLVLVVEAVPVELAEGEGDTVDCTAERAGPEVDDEAARDGALLTPPMAPGTNCDLGRCRAASPLLRTETQIREEPRQQEAKGKGEEGEAYGSAMMARWAAQCRKSLRCGR